VSKNKSKIFFALPDIGWRKWLHIVLCVILGLFFISIFLRTSDPTEIWAILRKVELVPILIALFAYAIDFVLRAFRFWTLLRYQSHNSLGFAPTIAPVIASFGISDLLPLRIGDAYRIYWFRQKFNLPTGDLVGAMIVERVLDLVSILIVAAFALMLMEQSFVPVLLFQLQLGIGLAAAACALTIMLPRVLEFASERLSRQFSKGLMARIARLVFSIAAAIRSMGDPVRMGRMMLLSVVLWLLESIVMLGAWIGLGQNIEEWSKPLLAFAFSTIGTLVPALPGHFGSYEYFGVIAYAAVGVEASFAAATILLAHLVLWLPTALFGIGWLIAATRRKEN
jgi:glycosyltransferase 2 family protein